MLLTKIRVYGALMMALDNKGGVTLVASNLEVEFAEHAETSGEELDPDDLTNDGYWIMMILRLWEEVG